jgi:hypothetical protein
VCKTLDSDRIGMQVEACISTRTSTLKAKKKPGHEQERWVSNSRSNRLHVLSTKPNCTVSTGGMSSVADLALLLN